MSVIVARWREWDGDGLQHLVLRTERDEIVAEAALVATEEGGYAGRYRIVCDGAWRTRRLEVELVGAVPRLVIAGDGRGHWTDGSGAALPALEGAIDVDLSATPFTNTLPIRRLALAPGESAEICTAYVLFPGLALSADPQRYTRLSPSRYRYESLDSDFTREIDVDAHGLVVLYPGLFRRIG
jgi:hypothetical protein